MSAISLRFSFIYKKNYLCSLHAGHYNTSQAAINTLFYHIVYYTDRIRSRGGRGTFNLHFKWLLTKIQNRRQNYLNTIIYILLTELPLCIGQFELGFGRLFFFLRKRELTFQELWYEHNTPSPFTGKTSVRWFLHHLDVLTILVKL